MEMVKLVKGDNRIIERRKVDYENNKTFGVSEGGLA